MRTRKRADRLGGGAAALRHVEADVVELHDQRDRAIDPEGHGERDQGERRGLFAAAEIAELVERDRHDFGREDEVGAHRALDLARLELGGGVGLGQLGLGMMVAGDRPR